MRKLLFVIAVSMISSSCLDSNIEISFNRNFSGTVSISYNISGETEYISSDLVKITYQYLPVDGDTIKKITDNVEGLTLDSYKRTQTGKGSVINIATRFTKAEDIEKIFGYEDGIKSLSIQNSVPGILKVILKNPLSPEISAQTLNLLNALYDDRNINITVRVPGLVTDADIGALTEDPEVAFLKIPLSRILMEKDRIVWTVRYTNR